MTKDQLRDSVATLDRQTIDYLLEGILKLKPGDPVVPGDLLAAGLYEWAIHRGFPVMSAWRLIEANLPALRQLPTPDFRGLTANARHQVIVHVVEDKWVSLLGEPKWLNTMSGDLVDELPIRPITVVSCSLVALQERLRASLDRRGIEV